MRHSDCLLRECLDVILYSEATGTNAFCVDVIMYSPVLRTERFSHGVPNLVMRMYGPVICQYSFLLPGYDAFVPVHLSASDAPRADIGNEPQIPHRTPFAL